MAFRVVITKPAQEDIESSVDFIAIDSIEAAMRWYEGLRASVQELEEMPHRFALCKTWARWISSSEPFPTTRTE